jgi:GNAT superfamily N-acetyltransferase
MDGLVIRLAIISEQKALEALQWRASLSNAGDRDALLANPDAIELPVEQIASDAVFVAEWNGAIAGFCSLLPRTDGDGELDALFVEPTLRRMGIGRALIEHCVLAAQRQGWAGLRVVGNPHAWDFYKACGFISIGTTETRFGPGLLLRKAL